MPSFGEKLKALAVSVHQWLYWHTDSTATDFHRTGAAPALPVGEHTAWSVGVHWGIDTHWNTNSRCSVGQWHTDTPTLSNCVLLFIFVNEESETGISIHLSWQQNEFSQYGTLNNNANYKDIFRLYWCVWSYYIRFCEDHEDQTKLCRGLKFLG